jgi:dTDP-4-dehydrorhamnose reductase
MRSRPLLVPRRPERFLVTGATGQVGHELVRELATLGQVIAPPREALDLANPASLREVVRRIAPTVIVNAGAYTAVDRAESEPALCALVNEAAPAVLAEEALRLGAALIHYSTDYVFDGRTTTPYVETDVTAPLNVYGRTKRDGEQALASVGGAWMVLRVSWVYSLRGANFLCTMLRLARERDELQVVDDQVGTPTWSRQIASATAQICAVASGAGSVHAWIAEHAGVYHLAGQGETSKLDFARAILAADPRRAEHRCTAILPASSAAFPGAIRPAVSLMDSRKLAEATGVSLPDWTLQLRLALEAS